METKKSRSNKYEAVYGIQSFHEMFDKKYSPKLFNKKGTGKEKIPLSLYKAIVKEYFDIYLKEIYFLNNTDYFLFGGMLTKCCTEPTVRMITKGNKIVYNRKASSIGLLWWMRPSILFKRFVSLSKLNGTTNKILEIEKLFKQNHDVELLPKFEKLKAAKTVSKTLYVK